MASVLLLANPASGRGRARKAAEALLERIPGAVLLERDARPTEGILVAVGGDGTVNEAARKVRGNPNLTLAVFPTGTVNLLARVYRLPPDVDGFVRLLSDGRVASLDLGLAGDRVFLSCAGAGFDADVVRRLHRGRSGGIRIWHYAPHILGALAAGSPPPLRVRIDGQDQGTFGQAIVGNLPLYAGFLRFTPEARGDDGLLDAALFPSGRRLDLVRYGIAATLGRNAGDVRILRGREIRLEGEGVPLQLDGDMAGELPVTLRVEPAALRLLVP